MTYPGDSLTPRRWQIETIAETASTNADLVQAAGNGAADGTVLVTDRQTAGRGRMGRSWIAPRGTALMFSALIRPRGVAIQHYSWVGTIFGIALCRMLRAHTGVAFGLKWPNDVLLAGDKCAGILAELAGDAVIVGVGLNVSMERSDLPRPDATSLHAAGIPADLLDHDLLLKALLAQVGGVLTEWENAQGDVINSGVLAAYRDISATIGTEVRITLPDGAEYVGYALDVTPSGAIVLQTEAGLQTFAAGDVHHLRTAKS